MMTTIAPNPEIIPQLPFRINNTKSSKFIYTNLQKSPITIYQKKCKRSNLYIKYHQVYDNDNNFEYNDTCLNIKDDLSSQNSTQASTNSILTEISKVTKNSLKVFKNKKQKNKYLDNGNDKTAGSLFDDRSDTDLSKQNQEMINFDLFVKEIDFDTEDEILSRNDYEESTEPIWNTLSVEQIITNIIFQANIIIQTDIFQIESKQEQQQYPENLFNKTKNVLRQKNQNLKIISKDSQIKSQRDKVTHSQPLQRKRTNASRTKIFQNTTSPKKISSNNSGENSSNNQKPERGNDGSPIRERLHINIGSSYKLSPSREQKKGNDDDDDDDDDDFMVSSKKIVGNDCGLESTNKIDIQPNFCPKISENITGISSFNTNSYDVRNKQGKPPIRNVKKLDDNESDDSIIFDSKMCGGEIERQPSSCINIKGNTHDSMLIENKLSQIRGITQKSPIQKQYPQVNGHKKTCTSA